MHKDQPRPNGADKEAGIPASSMKEGCKGGQLLRVDPNHSYRCSAFVVPRQTELLFPGSSSAARCPSPRSSLAPPRDGLVYKGRMARPCAERGGGVDTEVAGTAGRTRLPQLVQCSALQHPFRPPVPRGRSPYAPCDPRPANPRRRADLPLTLSCAWQRGSGGNRGSRWLCAIKGG